MLIVTAIALGLALHVRNVAFQKAAVDEIRQLGGIIRYDFQCNVDGESPGPFIDPAWKPGVGDKLRELLGEDFFHAVVSVELNGRNVADADLSTFACLSHIKRLYLNSTQITDESIKELMRLKSLKYLDISDTGLTEGGISRLRESIPDTVIRDDLEYQKMLRMMDEFTSGETTVFPNLELHIDP